MTKEFRLDAGDIGYYINAGKVVQGTVEKIDYNRTISTDATLYSMRGTAITVREGYIFKTKEELIASL